MATKNKSKEISNPKVFIFFMSLFLLSLVIVFISTFKPKESESVVSEFVEENESPVEELDRELNSFFDQPDANILNNNDVFYQSDPFREICGESGASDGPVVSFGTVCLR